jgi:Excalibur calcium-binding domain
MEHPVRRQIAIKTKYRLWVTAPERAAMARVLSTCPGQTLPAPHGGSTPAPPAQHTTTVAAPSTQIRPAPQPGDSPVYYPNCAAVRAARKAPLLRGQPGYRPALDRDDDGKACE